MKKIAIIGLGYVGLPLAHVFSEKYTVVGYDKSNERIEELNSGFDRTHELNSGQLEESLARGAKFSSDPKYLSDCNIYIVTVPTPIDKYNRPDISFLIDASKAIGRYLNIDDVVIYESTVYPGATEEDCVPVLESVSGLCYNKDFYCGYSPERINPGDKLRDIKNIVKVTSGSTPEIADFVDDLYSSVIDAGTYKAESISVAEAAKVIENTQRDINIALINELAIIFNLMGIDTQSVLNAASTKWNFLPFQPGLVGGHCIGVDPYYLTHKAQQLGYHPEIILAGRRINDGMGRYIVSELIKSALAKELLSKKCRVLVLGITFKENCPDLRNSRVEDILVELAQYNLEVDVYDPCADRDEAKVKYGVDLIHKPEKEAYEIILLAVAHQEFYEINIDEFRKENSLLFDIKGILDRQVTNWRL